MPMETAAMTINASFTTLTHATPLERGRDVLAHAIDVEPESRLRAVIGAGRIEVNSFHHQAVKRVAPRLRQTARRPTFRFRPCRCKAIARRPRDHRSPPSRRGKLLRRLPRPLQPPM